MQHFVHIIECIHNQTVELLPFIFSVVKCTNCIVWFTIYSKPFVSHIQAHCMREIANCKLKWNMTHHHKSWHRSVPLGTYISQKVKYQCVNMGFFISITAWLNGWGWFLIYKGYFKTNLPYFRRMFLGLTSTNITKQAEVDPLQR